MSHVRLGYMDLSGRSSVLHGEDDAVLSCLLWEAHSAGEKLKLGRDMGVVQEKLSGMNSYFFTFGLVGTGDPVSSPW